MLLPVMYDLLNGVHFIGIGCVIEEHKSLEEYVKQSFNRQTAAGTVHNYRSIGYRWPIYHKNVLLHPSLLPFDAGV